MVRGLTLAGKMNLSPVGCFLKGTVVIRLLHGALAASDTRPVLFWLWETLAVCFSSCCLDPQ